ncbi:MAG: hypothetical protein Q8S32_17305 [Burkholderiaceae bacterium]|nr:hypothetical protein [Burkholderiaceae bacterium]
MALITADSVSITADSLLTADGFIGWPVGLPAPVVPGFSMEPEESTIRTDMEVGSPRVRLRTLAERDALEVAWKFTDAQMAVFREWWRTTASFGAAWFDVELPLGNGGVQACEARFVGRWKSQLKPGMCWDVTGKVEVRNA